MDTPSDCQEQKNSTNVVALNILDDEAKKDLESKLDAFLEYLGVSLMPYQRDIFMIYLAKAIFNKKEEE